MDLRDGVSAFAQEEVRANRGADPQLERGIDVARHEVWSPPWEDFGHDPEGHQEKLCDTNARDWARGRAKGESFVLSFLWRNRVRSSRVAAHPGRPKAWPERRDSPRLFSD